MSLSPLRILYVEDNEDLRSTIGMLLEGDDREVVTCPDAAQALGVLAERAFDVVVTDVSLPGLTGTELARRLLAVKPDHWVVLCSGYEFRHGLSELGPNVRSLSKPFELEDLESLLQEIAAAVRV
jgi:CheY-like chemotaxis protein